MRQVVLDTETTGLEPNDGHRIIEIGCVELVNRKLTGRHLHLYLNPDREIDEGALQVHGISSAFLADKPRFHQVVDEFIAFVDGAELVIHNAPFDMGFLNHEIKALDQGRPPLEQLCSVLDTLKLARRMHPGQKNNLDILCRRYGIDNAHRTLHGALLDAEILAEVYLAMTGGQTRLFNTGGDGDSGDVANRETRRPVNLAKGTLKVVPASAEEMRRHQQKLDRMAEKNGQPVLWS